MKCSQCDRPAIYLVGPPEGQVPLCLDCHAKLVQTLALQNDMHERQINYLTAQMEAVAGVPGVLARFPERRVVQVGDFTFNNIQVDRSTIGVLNTGSMGTVDVALTTLKQGGDRAIAAALQSLTEALIANRELQEKAKNQALEILSFIATEATAPKEKRRFAVIRPLLTELSTLLQGAAALSQLWNQYGPIIAAFFSGQ